MGMPRVATVSARQQIARLATVKSAAATALEAETAHGAETARIDRSRRGIAATDPTSRASRSRPVRVTRLPVVAMIFRCRRPPGHRRAMPNNCAGGGAARWGISYQETTPPGIVPGGFFYGSNALGMSHCPRRLSPHA
jgi:hypothetical protein